MEQAGSVNGEEPTRERKMEFCLLVARISLQLASKEERWELENIIRIVSDASFDAGGHCRQVKNTDDRKRMLEDSRNWTLAGESLTKKIVETGSRSSVSGAMLYRKDVLAVLEKEKAMGLSRDVFFNLKDVSESLEHSVGTLRGQKTQRRVQERVMGLKRGDL